MSSVVLRRRIPLMLLTLVVVATLTFALSVVVPGNPARALVGPRASPQDVAAVKRSLGLDDPLVQQYGRYMWHAAHLNFGYSYSNREPVSQVLRGRLPWTILLAVSAMVIQLGIGIPLGLILAEKAGSVSDRAGLGLSLILVVCPAFFLGLMLLYVFAVRTTLLPLGGSELPSGLLLPALTLGLPGAAWYTRIVRASCIEVLHSDFVRGLRAKGLPQRVILWKHVLRAGFGPTLTMLAMDFGFFLGGAVIVETVFAWPGVGLTAYLSLQQGDNAMLMGCVLLGAAFVLVMNLLADVTRAIVDPRVRAQR